MYFRTDVSVTVVFALACCARAGGTDDAAQSDSRRNTDSQRFASIDLLMLLVLTLAVFISPPRR
jgi:hypothetical protein